MEWFGELPERWDIKRIGVLFVENTQNNMNLASESPMQFRFGEIVQKKKTEKDVAFLDSIKRYIIVAPNDIMINGLNLNYDFITQRVAIVKQSGCITPAYISLRAKEQINPEYACYLLKTMDAQKLLNGLGTGIRLTLSYSELKKTFLPVPPRDEQDKIVRYLDWKVSQINKLINAKKKQCSFLKEQKQAVINTELTNVKADYIMCRYLATFQNGISEAGDFFTDGSPFVNYGDVYNNIVLPEIVNGKAKSNEKQQRTYSVENGDIFFTRTSETLNEVGLSSVCCKTIEQAVFSGFVIRMRPKQGVLDNSYAKYYFRSQFVREYFTREMNLVTRASLGQNLLKKLPVLLPALDKQEEIGKELDLCCERYNRLILSIQTEIALLHEYRTCLIANVVTGKLDVRDVVIPNYEDVEEVADTTDVATDEMEDEDNAN